MDKFKNRDKVKLNSKFEYISYISRRMRYTSMYEGKTGTVIGYSGTGKVAVEFDTMVFTEYKTRQSSHDNGCHNKGKLHYCWYIPETALDLIENDCVNESNDNMEITDEIISIL